MRTRIKICGIKECADAEAAVEAGADALGLVFVRQSPRYVDFDQAEAVLKCVGAFVETVGLFMNPDDEPDMLYRAVGELGIGSFQLHGRADKCVRELAPMRVMVTCSFEPDRILKRIRYAEKCRLAQGHISGLVIDTPDVTGLGGGTGETFDWSMLREVLDEAAVQIPIILAGGLTPENVGSAIEVVQPYAVDVSSGVESSRGVKDPVKIRDFIEAVLAV